MKKYLIITLISFISFVSAYAQEQNKKESAKDTTAVKEQTAQQVSKKGEKDKLNLQITVGPTFSQNESIDGNAKHTLYFGKDALAWDIHASLASEFSRCWGWRVALGVGQNKGRSNNWDEPVAKIYSFNDAEIFGDITFDLMDLFAPKRKSKFFNMKLFAGVGGLYTFGFSKENAPADTQSRLYFGARGGLDLRFRLADSFSLGLGGYGLIVTDDRFNGIVDDLPRDGRVGGNLSLIWHF